MKSKSPSGATKRRLAREERERSLREEAARMAAAGERPARLERFARLDSLLDRTRISGIRYAHAAGVELLREVLNDPIIDSDKRRKQATEIIRAVGMVTPKSLYDERIAALEKTLYPRHFEAGDGLEPLPVAPATPEKKP